VQVAPSALKPLRHVHLLSLHEEYAAAQSVLLKQMSPNCLSNPFPDLVPCPQSHCSQPFFILSEHSPGHLNSGQVVFPFLPLGQTQVGHPTVPVVSAHPSLHFGVEHCICGGPVEHVHVGHPSGPVVSLHPSLHFGVEHCICGASVVTGLLQRHTVHPLSSLLVKQSAGHGRLHLESASAVIGPLQRHSVHPLSSLLVEQPPGHCCLVHLGGEVANAQVVKAKITR